MKTRVAAVQLEFQYCSTPQEFIDRVRPPTEQAAEAGAQLILLPHQLSYMLFGMFDFDAKTGDSLDTLAKRQNVSTRDWLTERAEFVYEFYLHTFQSLASRVEAWLVPGTVIEPEGGALYSTAFVFNSAGETVGRQRQLNIPTREQNCGIMSGDASRVFETELGDFGILIAGDVSHSSIAPTLSERGAKLLLHLNRNDDDSDEFKRAAQANYVFGVEVGEKFSAIYTPMDYPNATGGILAQTTTAGDKLVIAELDFNKL